VRRLAPALVLQVALVACAPRVGGEPSPRVQRLTAEGATFRLEYGSEDAGVARELEALLPAAVRKARRWGELRVPVTIRVHPTHEALEAAVQRPGYPWLRAWARYASIDLQSPRTWSFFGAGRDEIAELVAHELTHCAMYQNAASDWSWAEKGIPLWFREGLASVTAEQGHRRPGAEPLWRFYRAAGGADPLRSPELLYRDDAELVYGTAHLAVEFLLRRYGDARVQAVLAHMRDGDAFGAAFARAIGIGAEDFERDFVRYVRWQGWRRDGS
jgi:hypothetical protein